jgi:hypothetical protein
MELRVGMEAKNYGEVARKEDLTEIEIMVRTLELSVLNRLISSCI